MPEPWQVIESTITYQDRWLTVRSDHCVDQAGRVIAPYHVLEYPTWVNVVALTPEAEVVLVRQYRHGAGWIFTEIPGGAVEADEASVEDAARRELREETGYSAEEFIRLGAAYANPASQNNVIWSFLALGASQTHSQSLDPSEDIEIVRTPFVEFLREIHDGRILAQGLHLAALHLAVRALLRSRRTDLAALREDLREEFLPSAD